MNMDSLMPQSKFSLTISIKTPRINFDILPTEALEDGKTLKKIIADFSESIVNRLKNEHGATSQNYETVTIQKSSLPSRSDQPTLWEVDALSISIEFLTQIKAGNGLQEIAQHFLGNGESITIKQLNDAYEQFIDSHRDFLKSMSCEYAFIDLVFEFATSDTIKQLATIEQVKEEGVALVKEYIRNNTNHM